MKITGKCAKAPFQTDESPRLFYGRKIPRTWVMVIDRKKAQVFYKNADTLELIVKAEPDDAERGMDLSNQRATPNLPTRTAQLRHEELHFAHALTRWLEEAFIHDAFDRLVLVAAPRMLGDIRKTMAEGLHDKIVSEIPKDMANLSVPEIKRHLSNVVYFKDRDFTSQGRKSALFS